ncbi:Gibberellin-regulated protein 2 [Acorus calamus]|uniref:Gibberellin-regulated protein 2 n=1 Tax=Acorus calamus TaxID=4465 RepID=A0AAV9ET95_ACOCL|nr:Gibberellin-regulated protein 2 [Acorus calamus]
MAKATMVFGLLLLFLVLELNTNIGPKAAKGDLEIDCGAKCEYRCSEASRHNMCIRACNTCCDRCHCVPPGTSGHENVCPCYANMTTHGGRHKCP